MPGKQLKLIFQISLLLISLIHFGIRKLIRVLRRTTTPVNNLYKLLYDRKSLSLWQPWASFIVWGLKTWETRGKDSKYRGNFCVHASKYDGGKKNPGKHLCETDPFFIKAMKDKGMKFEDLPFGAIVGQAEIGETFDTTYLKNLWTNEKQSFPVEREIAFGNYSPNRRGWKMLKPVEYNPVITNVSGKVYPFWDYDLQAPYYGQRVKFHEDHGHASGIERVGTIAGYEPKYKNHPFLIQEDTGCRAHWTDSVFKII